VPSAVTAFDRRIVPATYLAFLLHACWPQRADERRGRCRFIFIEYVLVDEVGNVAKLMLGRQERRCRDHYFRITSR
jgi:hypothetical protein